MPLTLLPAMFFGLFASLQLCRVAIWFANSGFGWEIPYPLALSWQADAGTFLFGVAMLCLTGAACNVFLEQLWGTLEREKPDFRCYWNTKRSSPWECVYRCWLVFSRSLVLALCSVMLHIAIPVVIACLAFAVAFLCLIAVFLSALLCALVIWLLNFIPGLAIAYPFGQSVVVNWIVYGLAIVMLLLAFFLVAQTLADSAPKALSAHF